jgi:hypothetical protein
MPNQTMTIFEIVVAALRKIRWGRVTLRHAEIDLLHDGVKQMMPPNSDEGPNIKCVAIMIDNEGDVYRITVESMVGDGDYQSQE